MNWKKHTRHVAALILIFGVAIIGSGMGVARADIVDRVLVVVNDDIILLSEVEQELSTVKKSLDSRGVSPAEQQVRLLRLRPRLLEQLIRDKLTDQQVARHKIEVTDDEVDATIGRIREANKLTDDEFRRALELEGMPYDTYREKIKEKILRNRLINREVKSKIVITESEIKQYYDQHIDRYAGSTKYKLRHILLKGTGDAPELRNGRIPEEIGVIRQRLQAGEAFEKLAMQFSDAPTAENGGQLGVFGTHMLTEEIRSALKGLKPNEISPVVETDQGYQIFFVEDIIQAGGKTLEEATPEIRETLYAEVVDQKFKEWLEDLRKRSHVQILE